MGKCPDHWCFDARIAMLLQYPPFGSPPLCPSSLRFGVASFADREHGFMYPAWHAVSLRAALSHRASPSGGLRAMLFGWAVGVHRFVNLRHRRSLPWHLSTP